MKILKILIFVLLITVLGVLAYMFFYKKPADQPNTVAKPLVSTVTINNTAIEVSLARTSTEKTKGLSGTTSLAQNSGMLFEFNPKSRPNFWMKEMIIPIDIIWISDAKVLGVEKNVPPPESGTPDARLQLYYPQAPVDYVLEVNAGFSDKNGIKAGDTVTFNLLP